MSIAKEFKDFAMRGNVVDLAVGVVIGGAFGKIVTSLVSDLIMPPLNLLTAKYGVNFKELVWRKKFDFPKLGDTGEHLKVNGEYAYETREVVLLNYGNFIQNIVDFVIIAFAIFMVVRLINSMKKAEVAAPPPPAPPAEDVLLLREIRDALAKNSPRRVD